MNSTQLRLSLFALLTVGAAPAAMAIERGCPVQKLPYEVLRARLLADRQVLQLTKAK